MSQTLKDKIKSRLTVAVSQRGHALIASSSRKAKRCSARAVNEKKVELSLKSRWIRLVDGLPRDFFTNSEAKMENLDPIEKGGTAYKSLKVREDNSEDLKRILGLRNGGVLQFGGGGRTWANFVCSVGQYARCCVVLGEVPDVYKLCNEGQLFDLARLQEPMQIFANYYEARGLEGSMCTKAKHLKKFCEEGMAWYQLKNDNESKGKCQDNATRMGSISQLYRRLEHAKDRQNRTIESRIEQGRFLSARDFQNAVKIAKKRLDGVMMTLENEEFSSFEAMAEERPNIVRKWCLNFLALLIFEGGGQRPQVYASLRLPSVVDLTLSDADLRTSEFFTLKTGLEKRPRPAHAPYFTLPRSVFDYVEFHTKKVIPVLHLRAGEAIEDWEKEGLILHSEDGRLLSSGDITNSLRSFMTRIDGELKDITTMDVRSCFATRAIMEYNESRHNNRTSVSKEAYLSDLSDHMNTSINMLERVYAAVDSREFHQVAERVYQVFAKPNKS